MRKTMIMDRLDNKETKGCFRYGFVNGDVGITTVYLRKESLKALPPLRIKLTVETWGEETP